MTLDATLVFTLSPSSWDGLPVHPPLAVHLAPNNVTVGQLQNLPTALKETILAEINQVTPDY